MSWLGALPGRSPRYRLSNTLFGPLIATCGRVGSFVLAFSGCERLLSTIVEKAGSCARFTALAWSERPSPLSSLMEVLRPEAPITRKQGYSVVPPRSRRLINLFSDMEVFASRGSGLLVFMFLI